MSISKPKSMPAAPGVYFFRDRGGKILYLGKAANLKNRLGSYFNKSPKDQRVSKILEAAKSADWQETDSEIEALILESQFIKKYRPPFNIMLRDDKQYFYVGFTPSTSSISSPQAGSGRAKEEFPKLVITHQPSHPKPYILNPSFIGPFTDGTALKATLRLLRRIFPYCTCKQKHNNYCLNYHLGNCPGFCCLKKKAMAKQAATYRENIAAIQDILDGKKKSLIKKFEKEMNTLAKMGNLEKAIELRDKIEKLKKVFENARIIKEIGRKETGRTDVLTELAESLRLPSVPRRIEGYDVSNIQGKFATGAMVVFARSAGSTSSPQANSGQANFQPDKNEYRKFKIRVAGGDTGMLQEIITRRFNHPEWPHPDLILIDGGKGQLNAAVFVLRNSKRKIPVIALTKNVRHRGDHIYASTKKSAVPLKNLPPAVRNLILQIDSEAHRFAIGYYRKLHKRDLVK